MYKKTATTISGKKLQHWYFTYCSKSSFFLPVTTKDYLGFYSVTDIYQLLRFICLIVLKHVYQKKKSGERKLLQPENKKYNKTRENFWYFLKVSQKYFCCFSIPLFYYKWKIFLILKEKNCFASFLPFTIQPL